ncbi:MAG: TetR/AcrR family transcriptional regulator [Gemmatimonas sp.]
MNFSPSPERPAPAAAQTPRRPMQERGRRLFDAILDAAAEILVESGLAGFTMQGVAARANTTTGSMYHFFPDGDSVLRALGERHIASIEAMLNDLLERDSAGWATMPLDEAVRKLCDPLVGYLEAHPDLFALPHERPLDGCEPEGHGLDTKSIEIFDRFIGARQPHATAEQRQLRARMMHSITEGVAMRAAQYPVVERSPLFQELHVAVAAYLKHYE